MDGDTGGDLVGLGIYTVPQAARLTGVPAASLRRWIYGYHYEYRGRLVNQPPVAPSAAQLKALGVVTFLDLIEIQFIHEFHKHGVSWPVLRAAAARACDLVGSDRPFASRRFVTDGETVFAEVAGSLGSSELLDLRNDQMAFRKILLPSLRAKLELGDRGVERLWPMGKKNPIVIDPARQFGQPILADAGVPTEALALAFEAAGSEDTVASWYGVSRAAVRAAVKYQQRLAA